MHPDWLRVLNTSHASFEGGAVAHFGDPRAEASAALSGEVIADLSHLALLKVTGDDAARFLSGQFTNEVPAPGTDTAALGAWCNPQGRVLVVFRMFRTEEAFYLLLPMELLETTHQRLLKYVLRARVSVADWSGQSVRIGLSGPSAASVLSRCGLAAAELDRVTAGNGCTAIRIAGPQPRFVLAGDCALISGVWRRAIEIARPVGLPAWILLDILAALPSVTAATRELFLPQMLNLDVLGGISFSKGCYPGQEIVARLKYRGRVKRRLHPGHASVDAPPPPGTRLVTAAADTNVGEIVSAVRHPDGGCAVLAVLDPELVAADGVRIGSVSGPAARFTMPPYTVNA